MASFWEVVGGADKGGILVREGQSLKSAECSERLSTGALIVEEDRAGERIRYRLVKGSGPRDGWISLKVAGKELIRPADAPAEERPAFLQQELPEHLRSAVPESKAFPFPKGKCFGKDGKMKMLYLHGGGVSKTIAQMQLNNTFKEVPEKKQLEWTIWTGPHSVPLGWNGDFSLKPFGPNFTVYFERLPFANCQWETWEGIEKTMREFKAFIKDNGPFDGAMGFDMGGEFLVHAAGLAQEGDPELQEAFRFMLLFTTTAPKHLSPMGQQRVKSPLCIPTVCSWANSDENHPYMEYEELPLFIHRDFREVIVHADGHRPPSFKKEQEVFQRFVRFLDAMQKGLPFVPSEHQDNALRSKLWLPMLRTVPQKLPEARRRRLLVVPDPMGAGLDLPRALEILQALKAKGELLETESKPWVISGPPPRPIERLQLLISVCTTTHEIFQQVAGPNFLVESVDYTEEQRRFNWHCKMEEVPSRQLLSKDIIDDESHDASAKAWARQLLSTFSREADDEVALVGLGTGAYIAFAMAKHLVEESSYVPAGLWLVDPPLRLPWASVTEPGVLRNCPLHCLVDRDSTYGPSWRYEVSTCGPFSTAVFESVEDMVQKVADGFKDR